MKRLFAIISLAALFAACEKQEIRQQEEEGQDCVVSLNMVGEITVSEDELTRSTPSTNDLYVVQIHKKENDEYVPFACGVFDDMSLCKRNLKKGSSYSVRVCMVRDAKDYLGEDFSLANDGIRQYNTRYERYYGTLKYDIPYITDSRYYNDITGPYYLYKGPGYDYNTSSYYKYYYKTDQLYYNSNEYIDYYTSSTSTSYSSDRYSDFRFSQIRVGVFGDIYYPTCTDWFYGEADDYSPNGETATLDVVLKRTGFKLKYELSGVTDGEVTVKVYNDRRTFIETTTNTASYESEEQFIAFLDTYSAWQYADDYTENMTVAVTWKRSIGVTQDLGTKIIQVKRNCLNNIRITLGSDDKGAGLSLSTESESSMGSNSSTIPVNPAQ